MFTRLHTAMALGIGLLLMGTPVLAGSERYCRSLEHIAVELTKFAHAGLSQDQTLALLANISPDPLNDELLFVNMAIARRIYANPTWTPAQASTAIYDACRRWEYGPFGPGVPRR
jgi:hypothetical protein